MRCGADCPQPCAIDIEAERIRSSRLVTRPVADWFKEDVTAPLIHFRIESYIPLGGTPIAFDFETGRRIETGGRPDHSDSEFTETKYCSKI